MYLSVPVSPCHLTSMPPSLNTASAGFSAAFGRVQRISPIISRRFRTTISEASFWTWLVPSQVS